MINILKVNLRCVLMPDTLSAIYLYGSFVNGSLRADSDIDIAILSIHGVNELDRLELISKVEGIFTSLLKRIGIQQEVSILDMRAKYISLQLQYKVITEGILLYEKDRLERLDFENAIKGEYFDFMPYLSFLRKRKYGDILQKV